jgi:hypothetical protein
MKRGHPGGPSLNWEPEQTIVVPVSDYMPEIYLGDFYFADGMQWNLGRYSVPDPDHRGKFKPLHADYFPARRGRNWPPGYEQPQLSQLEEL